MARCDCGRISVNCSGGCGCACVEGGDCYVICEGGPVFGPFRGFLPNEAAIDLHTHGSIPLVDMVRLLNFAFEGGINVSVPSSRFDEKVKLKMTAKLPEIIKKLKLEHAK